jgi:hypothetical protein
MNDEGKVSETDRDRSAINRKKKCIVKRSMIRCFVIALSLLSALHEYLVFWWKTRFQNIKKN